MNAFISQIARQTGESIKTISQLGFQIMRAERSADVEVDPILLIDCPCCGTAIFLAEEVDDLPELAECNTCDALFDYHEDEVYPLDSTPAETDVNERHIPYGLVGR